MSLIMADLVSCPSRRAYCKRIHEEMLLEHIEYKALLIMMDEAYDKIDSLRKQIREMGGEDLDTTEYKTCTGCQKV